ncbi:MAG: hypothetical protein GC179_27360 [Anaerolineaceae bacterium]|nr:hypothetical protein [Anaerolineaceae bacterium]
MRLKNVSFLFLMGGLLVVAGMSMLLLTSQPVLASSVPVYPVLDHPPIADCKPGSTDLQCGSQASSCKNCHEVQAQKPVNNDGTGWHESHAFGDFCVFCHAGNEQSTDKVAAHSGMVPPLSDVKAACQQCHTADLMERAQVYATTLNIKLGSTDNTPIPISPTNAITPAAAIDAVQATQPPAEVQPTTQAVVSAHVNNEVVINDPNMVDYVQRYNEIVLGERPVNWGNVILIGLIILVIVGGGGFVLINEMRLHVPTTKMAPVEGQYPTDVVDMLPALVRLKLQTRSTLQRILNNPTKTDKVLNVIDTLISDNETEEHTP